MNAELCRRCGCPTRGHRACRVCRLVTAIRCGCCGHTEAVQTHVHHRARPRAVAAARPPHA